jgi:hypothetical protein
MVEASLHNVDVKQWTTLGSEGHHFVGIVCVVLLCVHCLCCIVVMCSIGFDSLYQVCRFCCDDTVTDLDTV